MPQAIQNRQMSAPLLEVHDLYISFPADKAQALGHAAPRLAVVSNLSLSVWRGEILAVVGASGSGKSMLAHAILGLLPGDAQSTGTLLYEGIPLTKAYLQQLRGSAIALVPQSVSYLDPLLRTEAQVLGARPTVQTRQAMRTVFARLGLCEKVGKLYPYQLSGGMARRVLFSTAVLHNAKLIVADEPTPGMSAQQATEALHIFRELADENRAVLLITHDLELALQTADRIAVFYAGSVLEIATAAEFAQGETALRHPYSRALWRAMPQNGFVPLAGHQPAANPLPQGCLFAPRCAFCSAQCKKEAPAMRMVRGGFVRCFYAE